MVIDQTFHTPGSVHVTLNINRKDILVEVKYSPDKYTVKASLITKQSNWLAVVNADQLCATEMSPAISL